VQGELLCEFFWLVALCAFAGFCSLIEHVLSCMCRAIALA
jgi:hypothetical protein